MIIVAGDSWGCGAWTDVGPRPVDPTIPNDNPLLHGGLAQFIKEAGHDVTNLSKGGSSNLQIVKRIRAWIDRNPDITVSNIIVLQTEYTRDSCQPFPGDLDNITASTSLANIWIARFYSNLSNIAMSTNCCVTLVGGMSDTPWFDDISQQYPGLRLACQSITNLLIKDDPRVLNPVFSWYDGSQLPIINEIKQRLSSHELEKFLDQLDQGYERETLLYSHPNYFWPDGRHPNEAGHLKLYCYLKDNNYI